MDRRGARFGEMLVEAAGEFASPEALITEAGAGRMVVLVDAAGRGVVALPASAATPDAINFMARYARGLVCLALTRARAAGLGLAPMPQRAVSSGRGAFTVSIEARNGVTTGISAADRAHTIRVALAPEAVAGDLVSPGHVFPLVAQDGGVLVEAGAAEAAVDLARLAGRTPAGVICDVMDDDGAVAGSTQLHAFADTHGLKIGAIADLIAYRRRHDGVVRRIDDAPLESAFGGAWRALTYTNLADGGRHLALVHGAPSAARPAAVRIHALSLFDDCLGALEGRGTVLADAMCEVARSGGGVVVLVGGAAGPFAPPGATAETPEVLREYGIGAQILVDLGLRDVVVLTASGRHRLIGLESYGLRIIGEQPILGLRKAVRLTCPENCVVY